MRRLLILLLFLAFPPVAGAGLEKNQVHKPDPIMCPTPTPEPSDTQTIYLDAFFFRNIPPLHEHTGLARGEPGSLEERVRRNPDDIHALTDLGLSLIQSERYQQAVDVFQKALRLQPNNATLHNDLGVVLFSVEQRSEEALAEFREAIRLNPNQPVYHFNLGIALESTNNMRQMQKGLPRDPKLDREAVEAYRRAIRIRPDFKEAHHNLAISLSGQDGSKEALAELQRALQIDPTFAWAYHNLGVLYHSLGMNKMAAQEFEQYLKYETEIEDAKEVSQWVEVICRLRRQDR